VPPRRFEFVHNAELWQVLEQAYTDGRLAMEEGDYDLAMRTSCGILEAIVTDALEHKGLGELAASGAPAGRSPIGLLKRGWGCGESGPHPRRLRSSTGSCKGLPAITPRVVRRSRFERDARLAGQVLNVIREI